MKNIMFANIHNITHKGVHEELIEMILPPPSMMRAVVQVHLAKLLK